MIDLHCELPVQFRETYDILGSVVPLADLTVELD